MPFRSEDELVHDGETLEEAFDGHIVDNEGALRQMKECCSNAETLQAIQDARAANGEDECNVED